MHNEAELLLDLVETVNIEPTVLFIGNHLALNDIIDFLSLPWACIYTTQTESKITNLLQVNDQRRVADIYTLDSSIKINLNWRALSVLRLRGLKGLENPCEPIEQEAITQALLEKIPELISVYGRIIFVGFDLTQSDDKELIRQLYMQVAKIKRQEYLYFFGVPSCIEDPYLEYLLKKNSAKVIVNSIEELWDLLRIEDCLPELLETETKSSMLYAKGQKIFMDSPLDQQLLLNIQPYAQLLEYHIVEQKDSFPKELSIQYFKSFLQHSTVGIPPWYGYRKDNMFHVERYFEKTLYKTTIKALRSAGGKKRQELPVMLCGPACSGKSNALGALAYTIFNNKQNPVLYIADPNIIFEETINNEGTNEKKLPDSIYNLNELLRQLESKMKDPVPTLIIWDTACRVEADLNKAYNLLLLLRSKGRRVQIVCTAYERTLSENREKYTCIDVEGKLHDGENELIETLLVDKAGFSKQDAINMIKVYGKQDSFIGELYLFEELHNTLRDRLRRENESGIEDAGALLVKISNDDACYMLQTVLKKKITEAIKKSETALSFSLSAPCDKTINQDNIKQIQKKFNTLMCCISMCTIYHEKLPLSMALRFLGTYSTETSKILQVLLRNTLLRSEDSDDGEPLLRIRSELESKLLLKTYDLKYIDLVIKLIRILSPGSNREQRLIQNLITLIGPNSKNPNLSLWNKSIYYPKFWDLLHELQEYRQKNPGNSLLLAELTLTRELFSIGEQRWKKEHTPDECVNSLDEAREIAEKEIKKHKEPLNRFLINLYVEWGNLCIQLCQYDHKRSKKELWQTVGKSMRPIMRQYPEIGFTYSAYLWAGIQYVDEIKNGNEKFKISEQLCHVKDMMPQEDCNNTLIAKINDIIDSINLNDNCFNKSIEEGKSYGIYFKARKLLGTGENKVDFRKPLKEDQTKTCLKIIKLLETPKYYPIVKKDAACLHILINVLWLLNTKTPIIPIWGNENTLVGIPEDLWEKLYLLCDSYLSLDEMRPPHIVYLLALCMAQIPKYRGEECERLFEELRKSTVYEKRRLHILCDNKGHPLTFSGRIQSYDHKRNRGRVNLKEAGFFNPVYFRSELIGQNESSLDTGVLLKDLYVATSFSGLQACRI